MKSVLIDLITANNLKMTQKVQSFLDVGATLHGDGDLNEFHESTVMYMQRKKKRNRSATNVHNGNTSSYSYDNTA